MVEKPIHIGPRERFITNGRQNDISLSHSAFGLFANPGLQAGGRVRGEDG